MTIQIFADGADFDPIVAQSKDPMIKGFTTNPTLMRKAGITDYKQFAQRVLQYFQEQKINKSISFEVFADEFDEMERQAVEIAGWGNKFDAEVYVKIPITNTKGESSCDLIRRLSGQGVKVNVTAITLVQQVEDAVRSLNPGVGAIISVFCGRIADTGVDPVPMIQQCREICDTVEGTQLLWASPREVLNIKQAEWSGCDIITVTPDLLKKMSLFNKDLAQYSLETVKMFYDDAAAAGFTI